MYEDLKLQLANEYPKDRVTYTNMKTEFIKRIMNG
ncbi:GrpB family protein [Acetobacterium sp.]